MAIIANKQNIKKCLGDLYFNEIAPVVHEER